MRILEITSELDGGGVDRLLYDYCTRLMPDIQFDFITTSKFEGMLEAPLKERGCRVYHVAQLREDLRLHKKQMESILADGQYDIVHDHSGYKAYFNLRLAKRHGVKGRIAHSHIANIPETTKSRWERKLFTPLTKAYATHLFACGRDAATWMWGRRAYDTGRVHIMTNAIDTAGFAFSEEKRSALRRELGLDGKFVIGNVARFSYQKNHEFLIRIFAEIKKQREDAVLLLIGRGELEDEVRQQVAQLGLSDAVVFMGVRNDVPELLNAMDVFLLPSRFEGLGIVYVEAQANGLLCFASKDVVPSEANVCDRVMYLPLSGTPEEWAAQVVNADCARTHGATAIICEAGYDISREADALKRYYQAICGC